jgi:hypothetical protein
VWLEYLLSGAVSAKLFSDNITAIKVVTFMKIFFIKKKLDVR